MKSLLMAFATFAALSGLQAQNFVNATNQPLKPVWELHVVLEQAHYVSTERLSAEYEFAVKESSLTNESVPFYIRLWQGSDVDNKGRDSIERMNAFFGSARTNSADGGAMKIQNTNTVSVLVFKSGWLFRNERGDLTAIGESRSPKWQSKEILEQFGGTNESRTVRSQTNSTSSGDDARR